MKRVLLGLMPAFLIVTMPWARLDAQGSSYSYYDTTNPPISVDGSVYSCSTDYCATSGVACSCDNGSCQYTGLPSVCCSLSNQNCTASACDASHKCTAITGTCVAFEGFDSSSDLGICVWSTLSSALGSQCVPMGTTGGPDYSNAVIPTSCIDSASGSPWTYGDCDCDGLLNGEPMTGSDFCLNYDAYCSTSDSDGGMKDGGISDDGMNDGGMNDSGAIGTTFTGRGGCSISSGSKSGDPRLPLVFGLLLLGTLFRRRRRR